MSSQPTPDIELPQPSYWPITLAVGLLLIGVGIVSTVILSLIGVIILLVSIAGWVRENRARASGEEE